ncbi:MAG: hypothetical protein H0T76_17020 [Nannocystis sp.]|nr:hypothetical protein [Nannocystis sp.]MBA3548186.1 hypothetical protein [Nannocystis sp.]
MGARRLAVKAVRTGEPGPKSAESGTCYRDSGQVPGPGTALALASFTRVCLRRPRRRV